MTRKEFEELVFDTYNRRADYPFEDDFETGGRAKPCNLCTVCHLNLPTAAEVDFGRFIPRK